MGWFIAVALMAYTQQQAVDRAWRILSGGKYFDQCVQRVWTAGVWYYIPIIR